MWAKPTVFSRWVSFCDADGSAYYVFDGQKIARVEQPEAGTRDFYVQEGQSIYSPLVSVHDEAADAQYWYLFDALGSTMGLVDGNGNLSGKLQYDAFGNVLAEDNVPRSAFFKYVGAYQYMPEEFEDMMLLWHRWYDPTVGRFVGRDAAGRIGTAALGDRWLQSAVPLTSANDGLGTAYCYACQRPVALFDASGDFPFLFLGIGVIIAAAIQSYCVQKAFALGSVQHSEGLDKLGHCIGTCELARCGVLPIVLPNGRVITDPAVLAFIYAALFEFINFKGNFDLMDIAADVIGAASSKFLGSCECLCRSGLKEWGVGYGWR